jgi:hypothetical protein
VETAKVVGIVIICIFALWFVLQIIWNVHLYYFEKEKAEDRAKSDEFYQKALETKDVSYCKQTLWESGCVVRVGQRWNDSRVCGDFGNLTTVDENFIFFCHAAVFNNISMCANLSNMYKGYCKDYVEDRNKPMEAFDDEHN